MKKFLKRIFIAILVIFIGLLVWIGIKQHNNNKHKKDDHSVTYRWSTSEIANKIPKLEKKHGKIEYDREDLFGVVIYDQKKKDYNSYVEKCYDAGFVNEIDDFNSESSLEHFAYNSENYRVQVTFYKEDSIEDGNSLVIEIQKMKDKSQETNSSSEQNNAQQSTNDSNEVSADFKATMDQYEKFFDSYVDFMKSYDANNSTATQLKKYTEFMNEYSKTMDALNKIDQNSLSAGDKAYYVEVMGRITQKLAEVGQ